MKEKKRKKMNEKKEEMGEKKKSRVRQNNFQAVKATKSPTTKIQL